MKKIRLLLFIIVGCSDNYSGRVVNKTVSNGKCVVGNPPNSSVSTMSNFAISCGNKRFVLRIDDGTFMDEYCYVSEKVFNLTSVGDLFECQIEKPQ